MGFSFRRNGKILQKFLKMNETSGDFRKHKKFVILSKLLSETTHIFFGQTFK